MTYFEENFSYSVLRSKQLDKTHTLNKIAVQAKKDFLSFGADAEIDFSPITSENTFIEVTLWEFTEKIPPLFGQCL